MKTLFVVALIISAISSSVGADVDKSVPYSGNIKYEKYHVNYDVNGDGTHTETDKVIIDILTEEGAKSANQLNISYSDSLEDVVILSAYTLKKDGHRIDVPPANVQERAAVARGGPMYSDIKTKVIIFPDVAVGDKVWYSVKSIQKQALFPGHFSMTQVFSKFLVYDDALVTVSVPADSLKLQVFAAGVQGGQTKNKDGRIHWSWNYKNQEIMTPENRSVDPIDYSPQIIVSSFKDYRAVAEAYEERAKPKAAVTEKIRNLAEELTRGVNNQREQAKILYTWVAKNIHYAGNELGTGSVVPHDTDMILYNRLGDCKDHAALLQALLAAKNIESSPVLINAGASYKLPEIPSLNVFNHVINYVSSLDLYIDSTSEYTPFGLLPPSEYGKPVIHTANFTGIHQTPLINYVANTYSMNMVIRIHEDGSADGETINDATGYISSAIKATMSQVQPNMEDLIVRQTIARDGYEGTGKLIKEDPLGLSDRYTYGSKYKLNNALNLPGPGAMQITPVFSGVSIDSAINNTLNKPERMLNYECYGGIITEEYIITLPIKVKIISIPKDLHLANNTARYDSAYRQKSDTISIIRKLEGWHSKPFCTPQDDKEFRPMARDILKDLKAQIIYLPAAGE